jgi:hypothetical protein
VRTEEEIKEHRDDLRRFLYVEAAIGQEPSRSVLIHEAVLSWILEEEAAFADSPVGFVHARTKEVLIEGLTEAEKKHPSLVIEFKAEMEKFVTDPRSVLP